MQNMSGGKTSVLGLDNNLAALLCYILTPCCFIGTVLSLIFFFTEKNNKFVKFHAMQSILLLAVSIVFSIILGFIGLAFGLMRMEILTYAIFGLRGIIGLIIFGLLIYAGIQAYQNNLTKLPIIGDLADKWSN
ncbi:MAG: DUF4870 domain-containing protein [Pyrinomonadaceae bacterium]